MRRIELGGHRRGAELREIGTAGVIALALVLFGFTAAVLGRFVSPRPTMTAASPVEAEPARRDESVLPTPEPPDPPTPAEVRAAVDGTQLAEALGRTGTAGGIGFIGPIAGPLNASVPNGPVGGPEWSRSPLPNAAGRIAFEIGEGAALESPDRGLDSELPDPKRIALSRLANPSSSDARPTEAPAGSPAVQARVSPERPLGLKLAVSRPARGYRGGDSVSARITATAPGYLALIRVDSAGKATIEFRSPIPSREAVCSLRLSEAGGGEYLLAVATVKPWNGSELAAAVRGTDHGFSIAPGILNASAAAASAWTQALAVIPSLGASGPTAQRFEWAAATQSLGVRAVPQTAEAGTSGGERSTTDPASGRPASPRDGSVLPGGG